MTCQNPEYQEFCAKVYEYIPCCKEIDKGNLSCVSSPCGNLNEIGPMLQFFELREIFLQKKMVNFHSQGTCMYPCIRPGDILHIEHRKAEQINIGDIAVYRRHNHLFGHRTIDKGSNNGSAYIVTRPDMAKFGKDGPIVDQDILGVVSHIERKGKILDTAKKEYSLVKKIGFNFIFRYHYLKGCLFSKVIYVICYIQQFKAYRKLARFFFPKPNKKINFSIHCPLNIKVADKFNKKISPQELVSLNRGMDGNSVSKWKIVLDIDSKPVASLSFIFKPNTCLFHGWWLAEAKTKIRYRGTKIEEELFARAKELLKQSGISQVYASIFEDAYFQRRLFSNLGFKEISHYEDDFRKRKILSYSCAS